MRRDRCIVLPVLLACGMLLATLEACTCTYEGAAGAGDGPRVDAGGIDLVREGYAGPDRADACPGYKAPVRAGTVAAAAISETSGLAVSRANPGVLWLHNDSGDTPRVFAISNAARLLGEYALSGAAAVDWEDMALGPGAVAGKSYLYLGDIGDNYSLRSSITVYRVLEPQVSTSQSPVQATLSGVEALTLVYPDGAHNAETLLIDPRGGDLYIVTKTGSGPAGLYLSAAPQSLASTRTLIRAGTVSLGTEITGGDISADGREVLLRTYTGIHLWRWPLTATLAAALQVQPCQVPAAAEPQGEAVAFAPQTRDCYTLSEQTSPPLFIYQRR